MQTKFLLFVDKCMKTKPYVGNDSALAANSIRHQNNNNNVDVSMNQMNQIQN